MVSVVIAAHEEEAVIGQCLRALLEQRHVHPLEIVVCANGCADRTAAVARSYGVKVLDLPEPGKTGALNAAEDAVSTFPRIYLDADIVLAPDAVNRLVGSLNDSPGGIVAVPSRRIDTRGRPILVRSYFAVNSRLPIFRDALFGRGTICLSAPARARFDRFPTVIADDLFLDSLFTASERVVVPEVEVLIAAPHSTKELLNRLVRVRRGNSELRANAEFAGSSLRATDRWAWWRSVVRPNPELAPAAVPYVVITMLAAVLARRNSIDWGRDGSTRSSAGARV
ncbi:glycosyltransferase [Calidifontibacter indicus]|nr:glycosyltransferase [Calidifontibacter indicus]